MWRTVTWHALGGGVITIAQMISILTRRSKLVRPTARLWFIRGVFVSLCGLIILSLCAGCRQSKSEKPKAAVPAKVEMVPHESELATITLTEDAHRRLGITTAPVESRDVEQRRVFGGDVQVPSNSAISVVAPVPGIVQPMEAAQLPRPGDRIKAGTHVVDLKPLLSPERDVPTPAEEVQMVGARATLVAAQVAAQGDIERGRADLTGAQISLDRARKLLADRAGSQRAVDDANALVQVAQATLKAAQDRYNQLSQLLTTINAPSQPALADRITIDAPIDGIVRSVTVTAGQQVVSGTNLFEIINTDTIWIRVPVAVDLLRDIQPRTSGHIVALDGRSLVDDKSASVRPVVARSIDAPPTADAMNATADLYFEVANESLQLRPGQRVGVELPVGGKRQAAILPASSILYDVHGGTWVYVQDQPLRFKRQRVSLLWFQGTEAVVENHLPSTLAVVANGAAELFGTEFGAGK